MKLSVLKNSQIAIMVPAALNPDSKFENPLIKEKRKTEKSCFTTDSFIKSFNMIINHFFVLQAHSRPNF